MTCDDPRAASEDHDRPLHEAAFTAVGEAIVWADWADPSVDWERFDLVVIRSVWDYTERFEEFMGWLDAVAPLPTLHNPANVIRWNIDKRYLGELGDAGVAVVPTAYVDNAAEWNPLDTEIVVKPTISAGSRLTGRFAPGDKGALELAEQIWAAGKTAMVQPAVASVATDGEIAVVVFDGVPSHSFTKGPFLELGGGFLGGEYTEVVTPIPITDEARAAVERTQAAHAHLTSEPLLYARYDFVRLDDGTLALLEAELFEPSLFLPTDAGAAARFCAAALARASR